MFTGLRNRIELYEINRQEKKLDEEGRRVQKEAKEKKTPELYDEWYGSMARWEHDVIEWSRKKIVSDALIREADELHLPRPQF